MAKDDFHSITGLPEELGIDDDLQRTEQRLTVRLDSRRYGKPVTIVTGFDDDVNLKELASELKRTLATGGTVKHDEIELQGNHRERVSDELNAMGYAVDA